LAASRDLTGLDLVAFMVDGVHFGQHSCVVALGIGIDGTNYPLGVEEGSTENAAVVTPSARPEDEPHRKHGRPAFSLRTFGVPDGTSGLAAAVGERPILMA